MGHRVEAKCLDCGGVFTVDQGGGFLFHLVLCDKCGKTKSIGFDQLGKLHLCYLKGLQGPYRIATSEHDEYVQKHAPIKPISEQEYYEGIEAFAGECECSGKYCLDAPTRCPKCCSVRIEEGDITIMYD